MGTENTKPSSVLPFEELPVKTEYLADTTPSRSIQWSSPVNHGKLGREIKISPKAHVDINQPPVGIRFNVPTVNLIIGIGKDHVGYLFMDVEAWEALKQGQELNITTLKEFTEKFLK